MIYARPIVAGLLCAVISAFLAFLLTGAGHGWVAPFLWFSPALFVIYPLVAVRWVNSNVGYTSLWPEAVLLVLGMGGNGILLLSFLHEDYLPKIAIAGSIGVVLLWLFLWFAWQVRTAMTARRTFRRRAVQRLGT